LDVRSNRKHATDWPETKLHRWIGFVQCAMMANGILDLPGIKGMFDSVKNAYLETSQDQDLTDHLDPDNSFDIDVGGRDDSLARHAANTGGRLTAKLSVE
jgi:hypothetical protein